MSPLQGFLDGCVFYNVALSGLVDQTGHPWNCIVPFTLDVLAHNNNVVPIMIPIVHGLKLIRLVAALIV